MSRSGQKTAGLAIGKSMLKERVVPHGFESHYRKRHINGVHRHVVYLALPAFPIPPGRRVAHRAIVHVDAIAPADGIAPRRGRQRQSGRQVQLVAQPGDVRIAVVLQILIVSRSQRHGVVAAQQDFPPLAPDFVDVDAVSRSHQLQAELIAVARRHALYQVVNRPHLRGVCGARREGKHHRRDKQRTPQCRKFQALSHRFIIVREVLLPSGASRSPLHPFTLRADRDVSPSPAK